MSICGGENIIVNITEKFSYIPMLPDIYREPVFQPFCGVPSVMGKHTVAGVDIVGHGRHITRA